MRIFPELYTDERPHVEFWKILQIKNQHHIALPVVPQTIRPINKKPVFAPQCDLLEILGNVVKHFITLSQEKTDYKI